MNTDLQPRKCANPQCKVAVSGKCLEGLDLENCPTYGLEPQAEVVPDSQTSVAPVENLIRLRSAISLLLPRASELLRYHEGRVIAIIGPRDAGKTSLIASLYDLFQEGPVAGLSFAGSESLHAFELACHDSRAASGRVEPDQERTGHGDVRFYHLDLANASATGTITLLLGDRAGEEYRTAADDVVEAGPFPEVSRADTITVLVDGGRLLDSLTRHNTRSEIGLMLRALADGGFLSHHPQVVLVLTKLDLIQSSPHKDRALADFETVVERGSKIISPHAQDIEVVHIAAAPKDTSLARGTGVDILLEKWVRPKYRLNLAAAEPIESVRAILNLQMPANDQTGAT